MRCADAVRELATPSLGLDSAELARHLESCATCARSAATAQRFDALWEATRPVEPAAPAWDRVWSDVVRRDGPVILPMPANRSRRWLVPALVATVIAQAAAVLVAVGIALGGHGEPAPASAPMLAAQTSPAVEVVLDIQEGQTWIVQLVSDGNNQLTLKPSLLNPEDLVAYDGESPNPFDVAAQTPMVLINWAEGL